MILLIAVALSVVIALARGGRLAHLAQLSVRVGWLVFVAFALQIVITRELVPRLATKPSWSVALLVLSHLLLLAVAIANYRLPGMLVIGFGLALNLTAMLFNGGFMPVTREALEAADLAHLMIETAAGTRVAGSKEIVLSQSQARLWILSDIIVVPRPLLTIVSVGDIVLALGAFILFQRMLRPGPMRG
jgi:hypothetical protein